jgi:tetratricopeptide (TPR) repeat protein
MKKAKDASRFRDADLLRGQILLQLGKPKEALGIFQNEEKQCRSENNPSGLGYSLCLKAGAHWALGEEDTAQVLLEQAIDICTKCGNREILQLCMAAQLDLQSLQVQKLKEDQQS